MRDVMNSAAQRVLWGLYCRSIDRQDGWQAVTRIERVLLSDIGGTNARFALLNEGEIGAVERTKVADYATVADAIAAFLARHAAGDTTVAAILDFAGPVENNRAALTNSSWTIDAGDIRKLFGFRAVHLLNDFEAQAWGLPALASTDFWPRSS